MLALFTDEQVMVEQAVGRIAQDAALVNPSDLANFDGSKVWRALAESGYLGLRTRVDGGPLASGVEVMITATSLASHLVPVPFVGSAVLATELLALSGAPTEWVDDVGSGAVRYAVSLNTDLTNLADADGEGAIAWDCGGAGYVVGLRGPAGRRKVVRAAATDLLPLKSTDLTRDLARLQGEVSIEEVGDLSSEDEARWYALALTALAADLVGTMRGSLSRVLEYSKSRFQFGAEIGSFQAIQHLCAEAHVAIEASASTTRYAAWAVDELPAAEALIAARTAKAYASSVSRDVLETVMQVYGGIGHTWEHIAHLYLRRGLLSEQTLGTDRTQLLAIAASRLGGIHDGLS